MIINQNPAALLSKVTIQRGSEKTLSAILKTGQHSPKLHSADGSARPIPTISTHPPFTLLRMTRISTASWTETTEGAPTTIPYQYYGFTGDGNAKPPRNHHKSRSFGDSQTVSHDIDYAYDVFGAAFDTHFPRSDTETHGYDLLDRLEYA